MDRVSCMLVVVLAGSVLAGSAQAQRPAASRPGGAERANRLDPAERIRGMLKDVELTPQQRTMADSIIEQTRRNIEAAGTPQAKREAMQNAVLQIRSSVLTDAQRRQVDQQQRPGQRPAEVLRRLGLSPAQQADANKILEEARAATGSAGDPAARRQSHQEAMQKIRDTVLTADQRQKFDEMQAQQRKERESRRDGAERPARERRGAGKQRAAASQPG